jgi:cyclopropane-fatty-acyl-phospholipid synthase
MSSEYPLVVQTETARDGATIKNWVERLFARAGKLPCSFDVRTPGGTVRVGDGDPEFELTIHNQNGLSALKTLDELHIADAYVRGDLDIEGDVVKAMWLRDALFDDNRWLKLLNRKLLPLFVGRKKLNPSWIAKHYDSKNIQLYATDEDYHAYTPGIYLTDEETLEVSSHRKYQFAFDQLGLKEGDELLEIGCGWGGMTQFCAKRGVRVTAITLSKDQLGYTNALVAKLGLQDKAQASYQDFFTFEPGRRFDGISCMGVIEDLSDYPRVMERFAALLKPGARAYLDFASGKVPFATSGFVTKYIWPGTFRMVYMPQLMEAIDRSRIQLAALWNDRRNYYLWARNGQRRWVENKAKVVAEAGEEMYRLFRLLFMGTAGVMNNPNYAVTAYRLLLELPGEG